jgi:hypothetical protein
METIIADYLSRAIDELSLSAKDQATLTSLFSQLEDELLASESSLDTIYPDPLWADPLQSGI